MAFSLEKATALIGKSRSEYQCNHVVNEVLNGRKDIGGRAKDYLSYGSKVLTPSAGAVVVGKDGIHVGVFINDKEFVHSSSSLSKVIKAPLSQLPYVFPKGYEIRK
jgi:hypothetical protein